MLVLSRKVGERIVIPECNLGITVVAIEGNRVRLGLSAPPEVAVYREEVWFQIVEEQAECSVPDRLVQAGKESMLS
jgi:carbon storage regulator